MHTAALPSLPVNPLSRHKRRKSSLSGTYSVSSKGPNRLMIEVYFHHQSVCFFGSISRLQLCGFVFLDSTTQNDPQRIVRQRSPASTRR
jgi:hypothetical protein